MTVKVVHRPARITQPATRPDPEELAAPPQMADAPRGMPLQTLLPVVGAMSSVLMITVLRTNPLMIVVGALIFVVAIVSGVGMAVSQRGSGARQRRVQRERYLDYLEKVRARMRDRARAVRADAALVDPDPMTLLDLIRDPARLWERRRFHADFLRLRIGSGTVDWHELSVPEDSNPIEPFDELMHDELELVARHYSSISALPVSVRFDSAGEVSVIGSRDDVLSVARAMLAQAASLHSPDDLAIGAAFPDSSAGDWEGVDRLPHVVMAGSFDGPLERRRVASSSAAFSALVRDELGARAERAAAGKRGGGAALAEMPRMLVIVDDFGHVAEPIVVPDQDLSARELRMTVVHLLSDRLHEPSDTTVRIELVDEEMRIVDHRAPAASAARDRLVPDHLDAQSFTALSRSLSPLRPSASTQERTGDSFEQIGITDLLDIDDVTTLDTERTWQQRSPRDFLRVPIGLDDHGTPVLLDLKESAQLGMGPHGICIGATGSGKSEMLRTLVLGLVISHPPEDLSMILVDFKGGAAFAPFAGLPHIAGIIDNLADDPQLTKRAQTSIAGEVRRRQEMLRDADASPSISHYRQLRSTRPELPPLPHLLLVIDEFGELLTAEPDFVDLLLTIGRIGRSIGVHLLLSSQRIEQGKLRGLDTYLSYRLGLRTFSEAESSVILDTVDAFHLPAVPGYGYLKVDTTIYRRFRSGYVSGPAAPGMTTPVEADAPAVLRLPRFNSIETDRSNGTADVVDDALESTYTDRTLLDEAVDRLRSGERATTPVWLPPLPARLSLARALGGDDGAPSAMQVPVGLLDDPARQRQDPWLLDLTTGGGHLAIFGAPQTGRSTFLRTLTASLALTHTPAQVSVYGLDLSGGGLSRIERFPHVGGVATRSQRDRMARLLEELLAMVRERERIFRERNIDALPALRTMHARGELPELASADVVLVIDGFSSLRNDFEELEDAVGDLLLRGGSFGVHIVMAMTRWNDLRIAQQPLVGQRLELRLNDPGDSIVGRKLAETLKADQPGRVITDQKLFGQVALPILEDTADENIGEELDALGRRSAASWSGPAAAPIRLLPEQLSPESLPDPIDEPDLIPFGLRQDTLLPAFFDVTREQHLLVFGDAGSGKSTLLRGIAHGFMSRYSSEEVVIGVMDVRGTTVSGVEDDYLGGHAANITQAASLAASIARELERRSDPEEAAKKPGPRIVLLIDDHDILSSGGADPIAPLLPYLPSARDLRVHIIMSRPVAGSSRAMFDLGIQVVRDTGGTGFVMSGDRSEGQIFPRVYAEQMIPGRGRMVRRGENPRIVQVADFPDIVEDADAS